MSKVFPKKPFTLALCASRGGGKTSVLLQLVTTPESQGGYAKGFSEIYLFSPNILVDDKLTFLASILDPKKVFIEFDQQKIEDILNSNQFDNSRHKLIILDDCISERNFMDQTPDGILNRIATIGRNRNVSVIVVLQKFKGAPKTFRENLDGLVLFSGFSQDSINDIYCAEIPFPYFLKKDFMADYLVNTSEKYSFVSFNRQQDNSLFSYKPSEGKYRLLSNNSIKSKRSLELINHGISNRTDSDTGSGTKEEIKSSGTPRVEESVIRDTQIHSEPINETSSGGICPVSGVGGESIPDNSGTPTTSQA